MLVISKDKAVLTFVIVTTPNDESLEKRHNNVYSVLVPGLDIVLLNAGNADATKLKKHADIYPNFRYVESSQRSELELFLEASSLCRSDYFHASMPERYMPPAFFKVAVNLMESERETNLVYAKPVIADEQNSTQKEVISSSFCTRHYLQANRIVLSMYFAAQNNFLLDGLIRLSTLKTTNLWLNDKTWRNSLIVDLASKGTCFDLDQFNLKVDEKLLSESPVPFDFALMRNQMYSICENVKGIRNKSLLLLSALTNAVFAA